jgi:hypothetical protein
MLLGSSTYCWLQQPAPAGQPAAAPTPTPAKASRYAAEIFGSCSASRDLFAGGHPQPRRKLSLRRRANDDTGRNRQDAGYSPDADAIRRARVAYEYQSAGAAAAAEEDMDEPERTMSTAAADLRIGSPPPPPLAARVRQRSSMQWRRPPRYPTGSTEPTRTPAIGSGAWMALKAMVIFGATRLQEAVTAFRTRAAAAAAPSNRVSARGW